jgi:hypothetical protein
VKLAMTTGNLRSMLLLVRVLALLILLAGLLFLLVQGKRPVTFDALGMVAILVGTMATLLWFLLAHVIGRIDPLEADVAAIQRRKP